MSQQTSDEVVNRLVSLFFIVAVDANRRDVGRCVESLEVVYDNGSMMGNKSGLFSSNDLMRLVRKNRLPNTSCSATDKIQPSIGKEISRIPGHHNVSPGLRTQFINS